MFLLRPPVVSSSHCVVVPFGLVVVLPLSRHFVLSPRCVVIPFGLVAALPLSHHFGYPFPPHEQLLTAVVLSDGVVAVDTSHSCDVLSRTLVGNKSIKS